jgi:hypothetical protein
MIVFRKLLILGLILVMLLTPRVVLGDPSWWNELEVQGAHVVSEGAYFRFLVVNHYSFPIYVSVINDSEPIYVLPPNNYLNVNISESIYILPNSSANYDVIAPEVSFPYEKVTYTIIQSLDKPVSEHWVYIMKYQVTVLASGFVQILNTGLDPSFPIILIAIGLTLVVISLIIWQRKLHGNLKRSQKQVV